MFDLFATLLSSVTSFLFPIFASYKALKTSDPAQLTPWLMYWVVFNCCLLVESWVSFILAWVPFYGYIRFFFFLYLILPQTQGARVIYEERIHPFLEENEGTIDNLIASTHDRLKVAGMTYLRRAIEYLKINVLGLPPSEEEEPPAPAPAGQQGYTQSLLARFSVPTARWTGAAHTGSDFYNLLANAVSAATGATGGASGSRAAPDSGTLIPPNLRDSAEKMNFIAAQRERLSIVLSALDREAQEIQRDAGDAPPGAFAQGHQDNDASSRRRSSGLSKSRSETDFEKVEAESGAEGEDEGDGSLRRRHASGTGGGPWLSWGWASGAGTPKGTSREG
ncbi:TB2/DP1, HVA22 family protein [Hirsutella rhossiliensis]|uniref:Protein YOP1 n=1 Tax=Hirsutella rhossiliensis TaxID=111463 RepID=A0A9P8SG21_9HYPO|nr:TB2/DP1, HVA22 family domain-containing protein [Hirsutella rhossiliensis]KAH0961518.1 TB2/DP1, HVA22 family domain-containing protein [Hirsutella rhossiliensis]